MNKLLIYQVNEEEVNTRIDKFLTTKNKNLSRSVIKQLIKDGFVLVNNEKVKASYKVNLDDKIVVEEQESIDSNIKGENIPLDIIYEDDDIIVINKAQGMVVHPAPGHFSGTLVNALLFQKDKLSTINGIRRPGIVHRLDKDTSGIIMIAKNDKAHNFLADQLKQRKAKRVYLAIVHGVIEEDSGLINVPVGRDRSNRIKMAPTREGKEAITRFYVVERFDKYTLVECHLETGRTHQIRVHMNYINHPIASDQVYGVKQTLSGVGQYLHAKQLTIIHPTTKQTIVFEANLPESFENTLKKLRSENNL